MIDPLQNAKKPDKQEQERRLQQNLSRIRHRWLVLSGKGGVGKSTVAVNLACSLADQGFSVGLLDTDIHGPDVAKMLGIEGRMLGGTGERITPIKAYRRLKIVSMASLMPDPDTAVIWRGPMKMGAIRQFLADVDWGDLDHLVVDSPPGTGDEPLSTAQLIGRADGAIIVTSPQEVALLDSRKCVSFAKQLDLPIAGIIENFSGMVCPHCAQPIELFGSGGGKEAADELGVNFLGAIPVDPDVVTSGDQGRPFVHFHADSKTAAVFGEIVEKILGTVGLTTAATKAEQASQDDETERAKGTSKWIAVACEDDRGMEGSVSAHFGRCPHYTMVEVKGSKVVGHRIEANPTVEHRPGAMPKFIRDLGADVILAGGMGPKAVDIFRRYGIDVATGFSGKVDAAVQAYLGGNLTGIVPCNHDHPQSCGEHKPDEPCTDGAKVSQGVVYLKEEPMRVAIPTVSDAGLEAKMDPRFGRAPFYAILELKSGELLQVIPNKAADAAHGAGTGAAQMMREQNVQTVVAGRFGPKASQALRAMEIGLCTAPEGLTVKQALEALKSGNVTATD
jgi:ATP-binding protein involved in chromosome partitioning